MPSIFWLLVGCGEEPPVAPPRVPPANRVAEEAPPESAGAPEPPPTVRQGHIALQSPALGDVECGSAFAWDHPVLASWRAAPRSVAPNGIDQQYDFVARLPAATERAVLVIHPVRGDGTQRWPQPSVMAGATLTAQAYLRQGSLGAHAFVVEDPSGLSLCTLVFGDG